MAKDTYRFLLRLPPAMRERLAAAAERSGRSLNAELVHRIEQSFDPWRPVRRVAAPALAVMAIALSGLTGFLAVSAYGARDDRAQTRPAGCVVETVGAETPRSCAVGGAVARDSAFSGT
jgi:hypothetical protein